MTLKCKSTTASNGCIGWITLPNHDNARLQIFTSDWSFKTLLFHSEHRWKTIDACNSRKSTSTACIQIGLQYMI